jgi:hypothetical protein
VAGRGGRGIWLGSIRLEDLFEGLRFMKKLAMLASLLLLLLRPGLGLAGLASPYRGVKLPPRGVWPPPRMDPLRGLGLAIAGVEYDGPARVGVMLLVPRGVTCARRNPFTGLFMGLDRPERDPGGSSVFIDRSCRPAGLGYPLYIPAAAG